VSEARQRARESLLKARDGINSAKERRAENGSPAPTLGATIERYFSEYAGKRMRPRFLKETRRVLARDVAPLLDRPIADIERKEIRTVLGSIVAQGKEPHASHVWRYLRAMLNWAVAEEIIAVNPAAGIRDPDPRKPQQRERDRVLDEDEIRRFWLACDKTGCSFASLFKLLLLTTARRDELARAPWEEINLERCEWILPRERSKNDKTHVTHLAPLAVEILESLPTYPMGRGFLFTTTGNTPLHGYDSALNRVRAAMTGVPHFTLHDLRRTAASGMARLGIAESIVDRVLNHSTRKISSVARIYNRHEYLKERAQALEAWSRHVETLVRSTPSNVVELTGVR
jgi:integrase